MVYGWISTPFACPAIRLSSFVPSFASNVIFLYALPSFAPPAQLVFACDVVIAPTVPLDPVSDSNSLDAPVMSQ